MGVFLSTLALFIQYGDVFPTRVGVFRIHNSSKIYESGFSPHAWGCSAAAKSEKMKQNRFPHTRGGVPHAADSAADHAVGFPHTRGGVPN